MFTNIQRPIVPVNHQGCKNLPEDCLAINVATWNVRTLNDETDFKLTNLLNEMTRLDIDILGVAETHWTNDTEEAFEIRKHVVIHSCRKDQIHRQGVAIVLKKELIKQLEGYDLINERIMMIQMKTAQEPLFIFQIYVPDSSYSQIEKDELFSLLQQQLNKIPRKSRKIILGDFNGKVGANGIDIYPENCGKFGLGTMNDEGERLLNFCALNNLAVMNTMYKQRKNRLITWISPDGLTRNQIDYILIPINQKGLIKNCRVFNSADVNSDHSLLMMKYTISIPKVKHYQHQSKRFDVSKLKQQPIIDAFKVQLGGKFEPLINDLDNQSVEVSYNKFVDETNAITKNMIGYRKNKAIDTLSQETKDMREKRRSLRKKVISSKKSCKSTIQEYNRVNRIVKREVKKAKRKQLDEKIMKLEDDLNNNSHNLFKTVRELEGKPKKSLKNQKKDKTTKTGEVLKIWKDHFKQHLNTEFPHDENVIQSIPHPIPGTQQSIEELNITKEEVRNAISSLKNNKAPGSDLITAEVLKAGGEPIVNTLHLIFTKILKEETTPIHFSTMLITPVHKKGDKSMPQNYRAIALLSIPGKVLNKILLSKIREKTEVFTSDRQYGFRPNRGTVDAIFIVRQLMQKSKERGMNCHYHFVDFKNCF